MKIWKIPAEHKKKLEDWVKVKEDWEKGFEMVEMITGLKPTSISEKGLFQFYAKVETLPTGLKKGDSGMFSADLKTEPGKNMQAVWDKAKIPDTSLSGFTRFMFGKEFGEFTYKTDLVNKEVHLIEHFGWDPGEYEYEEIEI